MKIYKYFSSTLFNTSNSRKTIYICFQKYGLHKYKIKIKIDYKSMILMGKIYALGYL